MATVSLSRGGSVVAQTSVAVNAPSIRDDKRAQLMSGLQSTGWDYSLPSPGVHTLVQRCNGVDPTSQHPEVTFGALQFSNTLYVDGDEGARAASGDIWIETDPVYGKVYHVGCGKHSHGPFTSHIADDTNQLFWRCHTSVLSYDRPMFTDQGAASWDWYGFSTLFPSGWAGTFADWNLFMEVGYPTIQNPPFELGLWNGAIRGQRNCGVMSGTYPNYTYSESEYLPALLNYTDIVGKWVDFLVGIYWSSQSQGQMIVKTRCKANGENGYTTRWQKSGINTWQWVSGSSPNATGQLVHDIFGLYEGWEGSKTYHDGTFPRHDMSMYGWVRCPTEADARACLPA